MSKFPSSGRDASGYLVEIHAIGNAAKVSAVDPHTSLEVSIVGPLSAGRETLIRNAIAKLERMLKQRAGKPRQV